MKLLNKILFFSFLALGIFIRAENPPMPASPPGGGGGVGPGVPASPIDMYLFVLVIIAGALLIYYHRKTQKNLI